MLDQVQALDEMDVIRDLAYPLPVTVIVELLGIPTERRAHSQNDLVSALLMAEVDGKRLSNELSRTSRAMHEKQVVDTIRTLFRACLQGTEQGTFPLPLTTHIA